jgi:hypothetical protein
LFRVWGGEAADPVVYGKVYAAIKTKGNYALTNFEKEQIKNDLIKKRNVLTVTPEIVDPDYTHINLKGRFSIIKILLGYHLEQYHN